MEEQITNERTILIGIINGAKRDLLLNEITSLFYTRLLERQPDRTELKAKIMEMERARSDMVEFLEIAVELLREKEKRE